jgi:hypothetical protein
MTAYIRAVVLGNWQLKLTGLAVAVIIWSWVRAGQLTKTTIMVPLEFANAPRSWKFARKPPAALSVVVQVDRDALAKLAPGAIRAIVDLSGVSSRSVTLGVDPGDIVRPAGFIVLSIEPAALELSFRQVRRGE